MPEAEINIIPITPTRGILFTMLGSAGKYANIFGPSCSPPASLRAFFCRPSKKVIVEINVSYKRKNTIILKNTFSSSCRGWKTISKHKKMVRCLHNFPSKLYNSVGKVKTNK